MECPIVWAGAYCYVLSIGLLGLKGFKGGNYQVLPSSCWRVRGRLTFLPRIFYDIIPYFAKTSLPLPNTDTPVLNCQK